MLHWKPFEVPYSCATFDWYNLMINAFSITSQRNGLHYRNRRLQFECNSDIGLRPLRKYCAFLQLRYHSYTREGLVNKSFDHYKIVGALYEET